MNSSLRRARLLVLCGPLALGLLFSPLSSPGARAQDAPAAPVEVAPTAPGEAAPNTNGAGADATSWTTLRGDMQRTGSSSAQVSLPLSLGWRYTSNASAGSYSASPIVVGAPGAQRVYFAMGKSVMCINAQTGAADPTWKVPQLASSITAPLTLLSGEDGDFIISASQGGVINAFRATDGGRAWEVPTESGISNGGPIVVETNGGKRIVVATDAGQLLAVTTDGKIDPKWRVPLGRFGNPPSSAMALSQSGTMLYVVATDGKLYCIDVKMGRPAWAVTLPNATNVTPVVAGNRVVTAGIARIASYEASGGVNSWTVPSRGIVTAAPAFRVINGVPTLFYGTNEGNFYALDARDGSQEWKATGVGDFTGAPVVLDNMVLAGTRSGSLVAMNPKTGTVLWQYRLKTERLLNGGRGGRGGGGGRGGRGGTRGASLAPDNNGAMFQLVQDDGGGNDRGGGGDPRGGGGGTRGGGATGGGGGGRAQQFSKPYSITAPPAVINGQIFVQANDAAIYGFTSQSIDADPPRVIEPSIALPDDNDDLMALLVGDSTPPLVPGRGPFYFAAQLDDVGSGLDTKTITVSLDGVPVDAKNVEFDSKSGVLTVTLIDLTKGGTTFPDGSKTLAITAQDYAGNKLTGQYNFVVDNTAPAPSSRRGRGNGQGRGGGDQNDPNGGEPNDPNGGDPNDPNGGDPNNNGDIDNGNNGGDMGDGGDR